MALVQKKGGPYTKSEKRKRLEEVYKLHFDYGYSARKIAEFLNINRGTINRDLMFLYADVAKKQKHFESDIYVTQPVERLEIQRTRLRKQLDVAETFRERITIEKFIFEINIKIANFQIGRSEVRKIMTRIAAELINEELHKQKKNKRVITQDVFWDVSEKAHNKIMNIFDEDRKFYFL